MAEEKENASYKADIDRLLAAMNHFVEGSFSPIDRAEFDNPEIAEEFNAIIAKGTERNNRYLARINDAQLRIGDSSCMKTMLEEITTQQDAIAKLQDVRVEDNMDGRNAKDINLEILGLSEQLREMYASCIEELQESISLMKESEPVDRELLSRQCSHTLDRLQSMNTRINDLASDAEEFYEIIDAKILSNADFLRSVEALTNSYKNLSASCLETGRHLYRISRDVDNARNDMFRHFSWPTIHDRLRVYEVDHVTLGWRLYNNLVEFESLRLTQVNNPKSCKLGLWIESNRNDEFYANSEAFHKLDEAHKAFHDRCVECFEAKQNYDRALALEKFNEIMDVLKDFQEAMAQMHEYLRMNGITDETDVWKFRG